MTPPPARLPEDTFGLSLSKASAHQHNQDVEQSPESDPGHILGETTFDTYINDRAAVWNYKLSGYQVLKKWLSYREHRVLHRPIHEDEVLHFTNTARRTTAILQPVTQD